MIVNYKLRTKLSRQVTMKMVMQLMVGFFAAVIMTACSESDSQSNIDANVGSGSTNDIVTAEAENKAAIAVSNGPEITGADAAHPDEKPVVKANGELPPLPIEETGRVATLPESYPETWVMIDEASFFSMNILKKLASSIITPVSYTHLTLPTICSV